MEPDKRREIQRCVGKSNVLHRAHQISSSRVDLTDTRTLQTQVLHVARHQKPVSNGGQPREEGLGARAKMRALQQRSRNLPAPPIFLSSDQ